jgi:hypothetical protein
MLEGDYSVSKVKTGLQKLEESGILTSVKKEVEKVGEVKFYFLSQHTAMIQRMQKKMDVATDWIRKYSTNGRMKLMLGDHLHDVVKAELRIQGFEIVAEKTRKYQEKEWTKTMETLDIIAKHGTKNLAIGIEVKNMIPLAPISEVVSKIEMCDYFGIKPVFACRWLEQHRNEIVARGGFLWQFKKQLYPRGQEQLVKTLRNRFKFPVEVSSELPPSAVKEFKDWVQTFSN